MARSAAFQSMARLIRIARFCDRHGLSTREGLDVLRRSKRRRWSVTRVGASSGGAANSRPLERSVRLPAHSAGRWRRPPPSADVAIVGAGLAGLACGDGSGSTGCSPR